MPERIATMTNTFGVRPVYKAAVQEALKHETLFTDMVFRIHGNGEIDAREAGYLLAEFRASITANRMAVHAIHSEGKITDFGPDGI